MKISWQVYDDFDLIAATQAEREGLLLSQFAFEFEVMPR
jgi:hypothetical protein